MKKRIFLSLLIALFVVTTSWSQDYLPPYKITSDTAAYILLPTDNWEIMTDTTGNLIWDQAINSKLFQNNNDRINYEIDVYWLRFKIINGLPNEAKISLPEVASRTDLYAKTNGDKWQHFITGTGVKWSQRDGLKRIPAFTLSIPADDTITVYKRSYFNYVGFQPDTIKVSCGFTDKIIQTNYIDDNFHGLTEIQDSFLSITTMKLIITITAFLLCNICNYGQQYYKSEAKAAAQIGSAIQSFHWDTLAGKIPVLYSKNYKVRAQTIQELIEKCAAFYELKFPEIKFDLDIMVLDDKDWNKIHLNKLSSYGMPNCIPEISKLFIAADKQAIGKLFGETDHTSDTQLSEFDCIALHELGHAFLQKFNSLYTGKLWADEFLASYFAICFFEQNKNCPGLPSRRNRVSTEI